MLYSSRLIPLSYTGIDYGPINPVPASLDAKFPVKIYPNTSVLNVPPVQGFSVIVMFEVLEHMEQDMGREVLEHIKKFMLPDTTFFMSTPCYDGVNKAGNHVYEWGYHELREQLEVLGFYVRNVWGTFASIKDYKHLMSEAQLDLFDGLRDYYDSNVLSTIFAPIFPAQSRNCLWQLSL